MASTRATLQLALGMLAAGALFGLPSLYVPAIALALLTASAFAWVRIAARTAQVSLLDGPPTVEEGDAYPLRVRVEWGKVPAPGGELDHPALAEPIAIERRPRTVAGGAISFEHWGPRRVEPARLRVHDPLRLHRREVGGDPGQRVLVLPRAEPLRPPAGGNGGSPPHQAAGLQGQRANGRAAWAIDPEIDGVRAWRPGSPASRIHWPSVARTGELMERALEGGGDSSPLVALDLRAGDDEEALRKAVRAATSLCLHLARAGGCSLLLGGDPRPVAIDRGLRSWPGVHARLALVDPRRPGAAHPPRRGGAIIWVTPSRRLPERGRGGGETAGFLVTPEPVPGAQPAFEVAGCRGYPLAAIARASAGSADPSRRELGASP